MHQRRSDLEHRRHRLRRVLLAPVVAPDDAAHLAHVQLGRKGVTGRHRQEREKPVQLLGRIRNEVAVPGEDLGAALERPEGGSRDHRRDRAEPERKARDHTEVAAPSAQGPEEVRVPFFVRGHEAAVRKHDVGLDQVVDRQAERPGHVADASAEGQAANAGRGDDPERGYEAEGLSGVVDFAEERPAQHVCDSRIRIDDHAAQCREVDHEAVVDAPEAGTVVCATAHGDLQPRLTTDVDGGHHVGCVQALCDQARTLVDHRIEELPGGVVLSVARSNQPAPGTGAERFRQLGVGSENFGHSSLLSRRLPL